MPDKNSPAPSSLEKGSLAALRSVLVALVVVGALGIVGALLSYRADVAEARRQVRARLSHQGRLYGDSLSLHFNVLRAELQHLGDRHIDQLRVRDDELMMAVHDDQSLFGGGVALLQLDGTSLWSEPENAVPAAVVRQPWFQHVLGSDAEVIDALGIDDTSRIAMAHPVHEKGKLVAVLVGVINRADQLLYGVEGPGEQLLLLSGRDEVLVPVQEPEWTHARDFAGRVDQLRAHGGDVTWNIAGEESMGEAFGVKGTSLTVLALESEATSIAPIRTRLNVQLAFLLLLQVVTLGAFSLFLRRTWVAFADVEARIAEQEKLAALGTAASLIAHEVKNSLNGLKGAASLLQSGGDAALVSRTMKGQVERLGHLASSLLSFSRQSETRLVEMDLNAVTRETIDGLTSLPEFAEATVELTLDGALTLSSDPLLLMAAIDNLVRNAIEAAVGAKDLGRITVPTVRVSSRRDGARYVVAVEDNAGGPTRDFEQHLGEPFFTTKSRGIGLGLAMARRAVEQLGGSLVFARVEGGARFEIRLPAGGA